MWAPSTEENAWNISRKRVLQGHSKAILETNKAECYCQRVLKEHCKPEGIARGQCRRKCSDADANFQLQSAARTSGREERVGGKTDGSANCQLSATNQNTRRQFLQTHRCVNVINYCRKPSSAAINSLLRTADGLSLKLWRFELWQPRLYHPKIWLWHSWYLELLFGSLCNVLTWLLWFDFNETAETCNFQSLSQNLLELK